MTVELNDCAPSGMTIWVKEHHGSAGLLHVIGRLKRGGKSDAEVGHRHLRSSEVAA